MLKNRLECNEIQDNEIEDKMPSIIKLASTAALNVAENKIPNVSGIAKKNFGATMTSFGSYPSIFSNDSFSKKVESTTTKLSFLLLPALTTSKKIL